MKKFFFFVLMALLWNPGIDAQQSFLMTPDTLNTSIVSQGVYSAIEVSNNIMFAVEGDTVYSIDIESGDILQKLSKPDQDYVAFPSFITIDPNGFDLWVGYTTGDNSDDRIYSIDIKDNEWQHMATLAGNFDLAFWNGQPFVSGLNSTNWANPNGIWQLDLTGANEHRLIITTGGYSAGLDIDNEGNVYYGTNIFGENALLKWSETDIASTVNSDDDTLKTGDALVLANLSAGVYDIDLDEAGNLVFNCNNFVENTVESVIGVWDGANGYDTLAISDQFLTRLSTRGDVTINSPDNHVFALAYGTYIAEIHFDIPPVIDHPFIDFTITLGETEATEINLYDVFHDDDDHDSIFLFSISQNSNSALLSSEIDSNMLVLDVVGSTTEDVEIVIEGATHSYSVSDTLAVTITFPLGNEIFDPALAILIYPNPTTDYINITYNGNESGSVTIFDVNGKVVIQEAKFDFSSPISTSHLKTGVYMVQIRAGENIYYSRIIKQ